MGEGRSDVNILLDVKRIIAPMLSVCRRGELHKTRCSLRAYRRMITSGFDGNDRGNEFRIQGVLHRRVLHRLEIIEFR